MAQPESIRESAMYLWEGLLNTPYVWGGDDPTGIDCSGMVNWGMQGVGEMDRGQDFTAHDILHVRFAAKPRFKEGKMLRRGMLVFWGAPRITHVEVVFAVFGDKVLTIGASGGGRTTTSTDVAIAQNAFVQVKPLRPGWVAAIDPFSVMP